MDREPTLRERMRTFQRKYRLEDDDLVIILFAILEKELAEFNVIKGDLKNSFSGRLEEFSKFLRELKQHFSPENLREIEGQLARLIDLAGELERIPEAINFYFEEKFRIPEPVLARIADFIFLKYQILAEQRVRKWLVLRLAVALSFFLGLGFFLFSWGKFEGRSETLKTVQEIERWGSTSEGQALRELGRLNPHLLDCAGQGLEKIRLGNKTICKPVGGSRGWILP